MSLLKPNFFIRPASAKLASSPLKAKTQPSSDLFTEFEAFRTQIKREYNDRLMQNRPLTTKDDIFKQKTSSNSNKTSNIYATLPIKSGNKENLEEKANFFDSKNSRKSPSQIENIKKSLKELSAKKPDKIRDSLQNTLHLQREIGSFRTASDLKKDFKKPADFKSLLSSFETKPFYDNSKTIIDHLKNPEILKNSEKFQNSSFETQKLNFEAQKPSFDKSKINRNTEVYRFGTSGALSELETRAKFLRISPTKKVKSDFMNTFESSSKKIGGFTDKRIVGKILELQDNLIDLNDQEFNECSNQYFFHCFYRF